jgi:cell fate (sporulation/competence/biofilm development) regulator YlbF (YheA/YmcA/DUF963 family)
MSDSYLNELELAPPGVVRQSAHDFATALVETPQFQAYETAIGRLNDDAQAQHVLAALEKKQQALRGMLMLNAVSPQQRAELEQLQLAFMERPSVQAYFQAQADLMTICQAAADRLSEAIELNYAAACGSGCC